MECGALTLALSPFAKSKKCERGTVEAQGRQEHGQEALFKIGHGPVTPRDSRVLHAVADKSGRGRGGSTGI